MGGWRARLSPSIDEARKCPQGEVPLVIVPVGTPGGHPSNQKQDPPGPQKSPRGDKRQDHLGQRSLLCLPDQSLPEIHIPSSVKKIHSSRVYLHRIGR